MTLKYRTSGVSPSARLAGVGAGAGLAAASGVGVGFANSRWLTNSHTPLMFAGSSPSVSVLSMNAKARPWTNPTVSRAAIDARRHSRRLFISDGPPWEFLRKAFLLPMHA